VNFTRMVFRQEPKLGAVYGCDGAEGQHED
jgi:hypothetical protein